jgi:hypothetical protein
MCIRSENRYSIEIDWYIPNPPATHGYKQSAHIMTNLSDTSISLQPPSAARHNQFIVYRSPLPGNSSYLNRLKTSFTDMRSGALLAARQGLEKKLTKKTHGNLKSNASIDRYLKSKNRSENYYLTH